MLARRYATNYAHSGHSNTTTRRYGDRPSKKKTFLLFT